MTASLIETDYLVVGGGATAMAFVDTLLSESDAKVVMVDRQHRPGGHWNDAYSFVRLHQPSEYYGVASRELSRGSKDQLGSNAGLYGLASGAEVLAYFDQVMQEHFLPSGRVHWFPMSEYSEGLEGTHQVKSLTSGLIVPIQVRKKVVNATHIQTSLPLTHPPQYRVQAGVVCLPLNRLPQLSRPYTAYTVVGSGKTGVDACLWLLEHGVSPSSIRWIMPRDAWLLNRANLQPGLENFENSMGSLVGQFESIIGASSVAHLFEQLEARGLLLRVDPTVEPTMYRCATVSQPELEQLRRIGDVVRLGRVKSLESTRVVLEQGEVAADADTLYIDCSARAFGSQPEVAVFDGDRINLLPVRVCQVSISMALIAFVESHVSGLEEQNLLCQVVPLPDRPIDWLRMWAVTLTNMGRWRQHEGVTSWLSRCRLNPLAVFMRGVTAEHSDKIALAKEVAVKAATAAAKLPSLLAYELTHS